MDPIPICHAVLTTGPSMADHTLVLQYSDDGGMNWTNWEEESIGEVGEFGQRVVFTRLGSFRNRVIRIRCTAPRRCDVLGAVAVLQPTEG